MVFKNGKFFQRRQLGNSERSKKTNQNILGKKASGSIDFDSQNRSRKLSKIDKYLNNTQYSHLADWDAKDLHGDLIPMVQRQPKLVYNLAKRISDTLASKLLGPRVFPTLKLDEDPITKELFSHIINITDLKSKAIDIARFLGSHGSAFMRFKFVKGKLTLERYNSNFCYPTFDNSNELEEVTVKYIFEDLKDKDEQGNPIAKWYKLTLGKNSDILYDNPPASNDGSEPTFQVKATNKHELGFVQGTWFKIGDDTKSPDGPALVGEILGFIDCFNYSLSQSDKAVSYNQEPQLIIKGMDSDELEDLVKSSSSAWSLGREGAASYLETGLSGVETASKLRDKFKENAGDITRVVLLDPEKLIGSAQSAKAMEVLHGPLLDLIDEYRPYVSRGLVNLLQKMVATILLLSERGNTFVGLSIPEGYEPKSLNVQFDWPAVFPMTMQDLQQKVSVASAAAGASIISRETLTKWLAKDFNIESVEEEIAKIEAQPVINPFGF